MKEIAKRNDKCLRGGCERWFNATKQNRKLAECERCGWDREEDKMRKKLPLVVGKDGLRRIVIPAKPPIESEAVNDE